MKARDLTQRNSAIFADYLGGMSRNDLTAKYGIARGGIDSLLYRHRVLLPSEERSRRICEKYGAVRRQSPGRPVVWPDCPPELQADYYTLRRYYGSVRARQMLDPGMQA